MKGSGDKVSSNLSSGESCETVEKFCKVEMLGSEYFVRGLIVADKTRMEEMGRAFSVSADHLDFIVEGFGIDV
jgi:hypothetical protein